MGQSIHGKKESTLIVSWHCTFPKSKRRSANHHNSNYAHSQEFFRAIRKDSTAIYAYLDPLEISLVAKRDEVHRMVKEEERKRRKRKKKKANKELEKEAEVRLNEERERLETEREAETSLNRMEGMRRTIDESQITPDSEPSLPPFLFPQNLHSRAVRQDRQTNCPYPIYVKRRLFSYEELKIRM